MRQSKPLKPPKECEEDTRQHLSTGQMTESQALSRMIEYSTSVPPIVNYNINRCVNRLKYVSFITATANSLDNVTSHGFDSACMHMQRESDL